MLLLVIVAIFFSVLGEVETPSHQEAIKKHVEGMNLHPPKQTWNLKMDPWKRRFLLETTISRFHVNFWGCGLQPGLIILVWCL